MSNEVFLTEMKKSYDSLKYFHIQNNTLILSLDKVYAVSLNHTVLANLNPNLFFLKPNEIFQIIYVLELLYSDNLTDNENNFIIKFTNKYLEFNDNALENNNAEEQRVNALSIPIYTAYDPFFYNKPASTTIRNIINSHAEEINEGRGNHQKLVLKNPNAFYEEVNDDNYEYFKNAGFTTIILITASIVSTLLYIAFFILGK